MAGNASQKGRKARLRRSDLWYYDRLPPTAREALANAKFSWSAGAFYNSWKKGKPGYATGEAIAIRVEAADSYTINRGSNR